MNKPRSSNTSQHSTCVRIGSVPSVAHVGWMVQIPTTPILLTFTSRCGQLQLCGFNLVASCDVGNFTWILGSKAQCVDSMHPPSTKLFDPTTVNASADPAMMAHHHAQPLLVVHKYFN